MSSNDSQTIDRIVYLASLVSDKKAIDPYLDSLRAITSTASPETLERGLSPADSSKLTTLESEVTDYLLHKERLRTFTAESLKQHVYERVQVPKLITRLRWETAAIFAIALILAISASFLPISLRSHRQPQVIILTFLTLLYLGGTYLFYSCLQQFSAALRSIYQLFCVAFIFGSAAGLINFAVSLIAGNSPWYLNLLFLVSYVLMYAAARRLAQLQGIHSIGGNWKLVTAAAAIITILLVLTPQGRAVASLSGVGITSWLCAIAAVLALAATECMYHVWRQSTEHYRSPSLAIYLGLLASVIAWGLLAAVPFVSQPLIVANISNLFSALGITALVRAGYAFNKLSRQ